jgi:hypothetical protein
MFSLSMLSLWGFTIMTSHRYGYSVTQTENVPSYNLLLHSVDQVIIVLPVTG